MSVTIKRKDIGAVNKVYARLGSLGKKEVAVGFPAGKAQAYPDGTGVAFVAACHVFGMGVPRRDFMALAQSDIREHTKEIMARVAKAKTPEEAEKLMNAAGEKAKDDIKNAIIKLSDPPNTEATIERKGSSNPLVDTGHLVQSTTYVVRPKGGK